MSLRRLWVEQKQIQQNQVVLEGESFHHAVHVIRLRVGEEFEVVCGEAQAWHVQIKEIGKKRAIAEILGKNKLAALRLPHIHLALALPKWATFEWVVEKSVEMGVYSVQPLFSEFSYTRQQKDYSANKIERMQKIIRAATEQSARAELLKLYPPKRLLDFAGELNQNVECVCLFAYEGPTSLDIQTALQHRTFNSVKDIWVIVGSEGGFSEAEVRDLSKFGLEPVTMGEQILRVDTACLSLLSVIKYHVGLMRR